jgi:hypothetical protein
MDFSGVCQNPGCNAPKQQGISCSKHFNENVEDAWKRAKEIEEKVKKMDREAEDEKNIHIILALTSLLVGPPVLFLLCSSLKPLQSAYLATLSVERAFACQ